ncbi:hypothetical protein [Actinomadura sp. 6N118]|uniref:hypothetical protein n=1 Tax=Actinomadura sp. 6N118 TaxID=3375151 RepID=UPI00378B686A
MILTRGAVTLAIAASAVALAAPASANAAEAPAKTAAALAQPTSPAKPTTAAITSVAEVRQGALRVAKCKAYKAKPKKHWSGKLRGGFSDCRPNRIMWNHRIVVECRALNDRLYIKRGTIVGGYSVSGPVYCNRNYDKLHRMYVQQWSDN